MRFRVWKDRWVEETGIEEGSLVAGGVGPGKVSPWETSESSRLVVTS